MALRENFQVKVGAGNRVGQTASGENFRTREQLWAIQRYAMKIVARHTLNIACAMAALSFVTPGFAQPVAVELTGATSSSGLSGYPGSKFALGDANSTKSALTAFIIAERSDNPCSVSVGWEDVNNTASNGVTSKDLCGSKGPAKDGFVVTYANTGGLADRVFVTGVQVCMNKSDDRVKGMHLKGMRINDSGSLVSFGPDAQDSLTNCHKDHWKRWANCPAGQIATAALAHYEAGNTPRSLIGIGLDCRAVRVTSGSVATDSGNNTDATEPTVTAMNETIDCSATEDLDIRAVAWNITDDWTNFEQSVEAASDTNLGSCLKNRFSKNGKVQCVHEYNCNSIGCKLGFGPGLKKKIKIFQTFFDNIDNMPQPDRRACYAGLMIHEFSHTCEHYAESGPQSRAAAAFDYWKERFGSSSTLELGESCGLGGP